MKWGKSWPLETIQTVTSFSLATRRPLEGSTDLKFEAEGAGLAWGSVGNARKIEQGVAQQLPLVDGEAKRAEEHGLETPNGMSWRQQVISDLRILDGGTVGIGKAHEW